MSTLELRGVTGERLRGIDVGLGPGLHVVLGDRSDGLDEVVRFAAGVARPRSGRVLLDGVDPGHGPRGRIGCLLERQDLPPGETVAAAVERASGERGGTAARAMLGRAGITEWAGRRPVDLIEADRRTLALAVALAVDEPALLALDEPLEAAPAARSACLEALASTAARGGVVLCATHRVADALLLGGSLLLLDRGRLVRKPCVPVARDLVPGRAPGLIVRTRAPAELAALLRADPRAAGITVERVGVSELVLRGASLEQIALAAVQAARGGRVQLEAIAADVPSLAAVRAATEALMRSA